MKLLKLILVVFTIYFVRRFIQLYKVMKQIQENQLRAQTKETRTQSPGNNADGAIDVEYKILDC